MDKDEFKIIRKIPVEFLRFAFCLFRINEDLAVFLVEREAQYVSRVILAAMFAIQASTEVPTYEYEAELIILSEHLIFDALKKRAVDTRRAFLSRRY